MPLDIKGNTLLSFPFSSEFSENPNPLSRSPKSVETMEDQKEKKSVETMTYRDWSQLPSDLVIGIGEKLRNYGGYVRFRAVCPEWRRSLPAAPTHLPCRFPWLMLYQNSLPELYVLLTCGIRSLDPPGVSYLKSPPGFYDPLTCGIHSLDLPDVSPPRQVFCSSKGWLLVCEGPDVFCLNPLTGAEVKLPSLFSVRKHRPRGRVIGCMRAENLHCPLRLDVIALSDSPGSGGDFVAVAIISNSGELAYCKRGDESWILVPGTGGGYRDVTYCGSGFFYGLAYFTNLSIIDFNGGPDPPRVTTIETSPSSLGDLRHLVPFGDDLLLVCRDLETNEAGMAETAALYVYKLNQSTEDKWELLDHIENHVIFLGKASFSWPVFDLPGCKGNGVYFADDHSGNFDIYPPHVVGFLNLKDGTIEKLAHFEQSMSMTSAFANPIWVSPNPC